MTTAFLFPGQASALVGMPAEWGRASAPVRRLLEEASRLSGTPLPQMTSPAALARTSRFQPVLTALSTGIARELIGRGVRPDVVAGHSLGELAACAAAGAMRDEAAVGVAVARGRVMEREAARHPGGMLALPPGGRAEADALVTVGSANGVVTVAAHNASDRWVVSGEWSALREIGSRTAATRLAVAGPWHSPLMAGAVDEYRESLRDALTTPPSVPIGCNRTGEVVGDTGSLVELLAGQLTHCVYWAEAMATFRTLGVSRVVICGPGKALRRSVEEALPRAELFIVERPGDLAAVHSGVAA